jgi:hypothetical protein
MKLHSYLQAKAGVFGTEWNTLAVTGYKLALGSEIHFFCGL